MSRKPHPFVGIADEAAADARRTFHRVGGREPTAVVVAARVVVHSRQGWFQTMEDRRWFEWSFRDAWYDAYVARAIHEHPTDGA